LVLARGSEPTHSSPQPEPTDSSILTGFIEPEEDAIDLNLVVDSLLNPSRDNVATILPTYLGKRILETLGSSKATSSKSLPVRDGKNFVWSRSIALELSPLKTRSSRKKISQPYEITTENTSSNDNGPLRAMKALPREK
jgi:hypothetical protein